MNRRHLLRGLAVAALAPSLGAANVAAADLKLDLDILRRALDLHPGLFRYNTPKQIADSLATLSTRYLAATDQAGRYLALSAFLATLRCGHTYANFYNQRRPVATELFDRRTRLPFAFRWIQEQMVVTAPAVPAVTLAPGTVIESLDGVPAKKLLARLLPYVRADGGNDGKRRSLLSVQGLDSLETFDVFQGLLQPPRAASWRLRIRTPEGRRRDVELPAITLAERRAARPGTPKGAPEWSWEMTADSVATLTMPTWATYSFSWKEWQGWLTDRLDSLSGARALIVDLRENEGGEDVGDQVLARLLRADQRFDAGEQRVRFQTTPADLDPYLDTWDPSFRRLGLGGRPLADGFFTRPGAEEFSLLQARSPRIQIPVAALVGPVNSSATFQFAQRARSTGLIRLFGSQTGGNRRGINGSCFFFVRLPGSGLEFDLPLVATFPRDAQPDAGILPDVEVRETQEDLARGHDRTLATALQWATTV